MPKVFKPTILKRRRLDTAESLPVEEIEQQNSGLSRVCLADSFDRVETLSQHSHQENHIGTNMGG